MESEGKSIWPNEKEARDYLKKHKILELIEELSAHLIYRQPDDPKAFLIEHIEKIKAAKVNKKDFPYLFNEDDIKAIVRQIDPLGKGFITIKQYEDAMKSLGIKDYNQNPSMTANGNISTEQFLREAKHCLSRIHTIFGLNF